MNNVKTCFTLLLLVCWMNLVNAQKFFKGQLTYKDNKIVVGLINMPATPSDKKIKFKINESADPEKINSDLIRFITITSDNGKSCTLEHVELSKKEGWAFCFLVLEGYANLYLTGDGISTDKHGNVTPTSSYVSGRSMPEYYYMIKRKSEKYLTTLAITSPSKTMLGKAKAFRKMAVEYFKDYPELVKRINDKEFTEEDVPQVVSIYNEHMENK
jgi:hypothetical protein